MPSYLSFDRDGLEHLFWTIERAEAYIPTLKSILGDLASIRAQTNGLQVKIRWATDDQRQRLKGPLTELEGRRGSILGRLPGGIDIQDEVRGVVGFCSWGDAHEVYYLIHRLPEDRIRYFCTMSALNAGKLVNPDGNWISSGRSDGEVAHGELEEIPYNWRK